MRVFVFILFAVASMGDLDFNSKTRKFSVELLYHAQKDTDENVVLSPYAIWTMLASISYDTLGATRKQVSEVFLLTEERREFVERFSEQRTSVMKYGNVNITQHNFLFYDEDLNIHSESLKRLENDFSFVTEQLNFKNGNDALLRALGTMNGCDRWRLFLLKPVDFRDTSMIMCNCFSFQANWLEPLGRTGMNTYFSLPPFRRSDFDSLHASIAEVPYEGDIYSLLVMRPHVGYQCKQVLEGLRKLSVKDIIEKLQRDDRKIMSNDVVKLPLEQINSHVILNHPIFKMGLSNVFDQTSCNFQIFTSDYIYINEIAQRVSVTFDRYKTIVQVLTPSYKYTTPKSIVSSVDPFIFLIVEKSTATVLIGGIIQNSE